LTALAGLLFANGEDTKKTGFNIKEFLASLAPYLFIIILVTGIAFAIHSVFVHDRLSTNATIQTAEFGPTGISPFSATGEWKDPKQDVFAPGTSWPPSSYLIEHYWTFLALANRSALPLILFGGSILLALFLAWRIDINEFSLNPFYR